MCPPHGAAAKNAHTRSFAPHMPPPAFHRQASSGAAERAAAARSAANARASSPSLGTRGSCRRGPSPGKAATTKKDPIDKLKRIAKELGYATDASIKEIEKEVRAVVDEAVAFAKADGEPPLTELYTDVEVPNPEYIRGTDGIYGHGQCEWARQ